MSCLMLNRNGLSCANILDKLEFRDPFYPHLLQWIRINKRVRFKLESWR